MILRLLFLDVCDSEESERAERKETNSLERRSHRPMWFLGNRSFNRNPSVYVCLLVCVRLYDCGVFTLQYLAPWCDLWFSTLYKSNRIELCLCELLMSVPMFLWMFSAKIKHISAKNCVFVRELCEYQYPWKHALSRFLSRKEQFHGFSKNIITIALVYLSDVVR